uniref:Uncharacterized protein n=1 Tax=Solanum lycopersicum TaxID=4081 RepID=A0A3Q7GC85_SOLLC
MDSSMCSSAPDPEMWIIQGTLAWRTPPVRIGIRPAELFFQMHLLARRLTEGSVAMSNLEPSTSPLRWILQAIHINPSCLRYWRALLKFME